jgi:hypothetical protein
MVLPNVLCALNFASSVMMNGVCCYYQMHEEQERRKEQEAAIQCAIRNELDMRRHKEMEERERDIITTHYQAQRRRKLMTQKQACGLLGESLSTGDDVARNHRQPSPFGNHTPDATLYDPDFVPVHKKYHSNKQVSSVEMQGFCPALTQHKQEKLEVPISNKNLANNGLRQSRSGPSSLMDEDSSDEGDWEEIGLE